MTMFSQNLHHLSPKGKCTTLARNSIQNGHPTLYSSWSPGSASPGSSMPCFPLPFDWGSLELPGVPRVTQSQACRPPSPRHCYPSSPGSPTFLLRLTGLRCPAHSSLSSRALWGSQAGASPLGSVQNSPVLPLPLPNTKRQRLAPRPTLTVHSPPPTDAESGF